MQRWLSILLGLAAFGLAVAVVVRTMSDRSLPPKVASTEVRDAGTAPVDAAKAPEPTATTNKDAAALDLALLDPGADSPPTGLLQGRFPDGRPVPPLPDNAPRHVKLGIVLMGFAGAQGFPPTARPKKEAAELAAKLAGDAKTDFHGAVVRGDSGSSDDIGRLPRGVLEPYLEYTVFTLPVGGVSDAIETPRGFWIARRSE
jgi:hypothetical protein